MRKPTINIVNAEDLGQKFACEVSTLPGNVVLLGWSAEAVRHAATEHRALP